MLFAVIGTSAGKTRDEVMVLYPVTKHFWISLLPEAKLLE